MRVGCGYETSLSDATFRAREQSLGRPASRFAVRGSRVRFATRRPMLRAVVTSVTLRAPRCSFLCKAPASASPDPIEGIMTATTLSASAVPEAELSQLDVLQRSLPQESPLRYALAQMTEDLRHGSDVVLARQDESVSTTEAARVLGVSRPHLYKVLDSGALAFTLAGTHRRVRLGDLQNYLAQADTLRKADAVYVTNRGAGSAGLIELID